ncbi:MAG: hypothetical protein JOZ55_00780 [Alphaproteobacteria bacterium]|nr:hypothetical protein [Alphaproteobacteria bacterium]
MKTLILSGAAAIALVVAPALAETGSSPAERAQTRALNDAARTGTYAAPTSLNGGATSPPPVVQPPEGQAIDPHAFIPLATVDPDRLKGATVEDSTGTPVGHAVGVKLAPNGMPAEVRIELADGSHIHLDQSALRFNPQADILLTNVDLGQLHALSRD